MTLKVTLELCLSAHHRRGTVAAICPTVATNKSTTHVRQRNKSEDALSLKTLSRFDAVQPEELQFLLNSLPKLSKDESLHLSRALMQIHRQQPLNDELGRRVDEASEAADKARYLAMSLNLGVTDRAESLCKLQEDTMVRTALIHGFKDFPGNVGAVARTMGRAGPDLRSALCIAIGTLGPEAVDSTGPILQTLYTDAKDAGTHSAAHWALQQQGLGPADLEKLAQASTKSGSTFDWYVNSQGMTMLKVPGGMFRMGNVDDNENPSDADKAESFDSFWMSDGEVTVGQFQAFVEATQNQINWVGHNDADSPTTEHPVQMVSWYDAIEYCNWLTAKENESLPKDEPLTPYYEFAEIQREKEGGPIRSAVVNELGGNGYRLPTEREWEYACRSMCTQDFCFGNDRLLLASYGLYHTDQTDATQVTGQKMPNGWGLFDMHGNVWEWCWDKFHADSKSRVLRGGSFNELYPLILRSAYRKNLTPDNRYGVSGIRISRTP